LLIHLLPWPILLSFSLFGRALWVTILGCFGLATLFNAVHQMAAYQVSMPWNGTPVYLMLMQAVAAFGMTYYTLELRWAKRQEQWRMLHPDAPKEPWPVRFGQLKEKIATAITHRKINTYQTMKAKRKQAKEWQKNQFKALQKWLTQLPGKWQKTRTKLNKSLERLKAQVPKQGSKLLSVVYAKIKAKIKLIVQYVKNIPRQYATKQRQIVGQSRAKYKVVQTKVKHVAALVKGQPKKAVAWVRGKQKISAQRVANARKVMVRWIRNIVMLKNSIRRIPKMIFVKIKTGQQKIKTLKQAFRVRWHASIKSIKTSPAWAKKKLPAIRNQIYTNPKVAAVLQYGKAVYKEIFPFEFKIPKLAMFHQTTKSIQKLPAKPMPKPVAVP
jgi:hypothetical protein